MFFSCWCGRCRDRGDLVLYFGVYVLDIGWYRVRVVEIGKNKIERVGLILRLRLLEVIFWVWEFSFDLIIGFFLFLFLSMRFLEGLNRYWGWGMGVFGRGVYYGVEC